VGPTHAVDELIAMDPSATWDSSLNNNRGGIANSCAETSTCPGGTNRSPRLIAISVFNVDQFDYDRAVGPGGVNIPITVVKIIGLFLDRIVSNDVYGRIMYYPTLNFTGTPGSGTFAKNIILVR
jgi:hypothetical protein